MCQTLVEQQKALEIYLMRWDKMHLNLKPEEWMTIKKMVGLLEPLESASNQLCRANEPISVQFPIARALTADIYAITDPELRVIRGKLLGMLVENFDVEYEKIHGMATFLDARFKDRISSDKAKFREKVASWIKQECTQENHAVVVEDAG
uniref:Uncharacterized protein n=1 Tax=Ditylenchus dipsaci TaxID=166011 RepID=A0A915EQW4_9BILA